jgi:hypothetical protein
LKVATVRAGIAFGDGRHSVTWRPIKTSTRPLQTPIDLIEMNMAFQSSKLCNEVVY